MNKHLSQAVIRQTGRLMRAEKKNREEKKKPLCRKRSLIVAKTPAQHTNLS
jgi:hypothetical protein